ncbi:hypothetical protein AQ616_01985 [Oceanobacillus sp. E9]|uniref:hypothetical protein n=2 Tax=Oceanobacillus TaxID=182709 RepID=UPI00086E0207|nr:hypothetical protein [Oceanobacillus sp. E9]OEH56313.1 hypothetical protein AQ616_01985 [Oceanobacillus sp. E9]
MGIRVSYEATRNFMEFLLFETKFIKNRYIVKETYSLPINLILRIDKAGEAISSGLNAINPMNWGWS